MCILQTKNWLLTFVDRFFIDKLVTQIGVMVYDTGLLPGTIILNGASESTTLKTRINNINWPNSNSATFDVIAAANYASNTILRPNQGWRNQSTIVIFVAIGPL
jgi:hypothetical protein